VWQLDDIHDAGFTGQGTAVAVIDTGIQADHPALAGSVVFEACWANGGCGIDRDNIVAGYMEEGPGTSLPCDNEDDCSHGTSMAGLIAASANGDIGDAVAPDAKIASFNFQGAFNQVVETTEMLQMWQRILELRQDGVANIVAINQSWGDSIRFTENCVNPVLDAAVANLADAGISVISGAGNNGYQPGVIFPACLAGVYTAGATRDGLFDEQNRADLNQGELVEIYVSKLGGIGEPTEFDTIFTTATFDEYDTVGGTSAATALLSGSFALLSSIDPTLNGDEIMDVMIATAKVATEFDGTERPLLDLRAAANQVIDNLGGPPDDVEVACQTSGIDGAVQIGWTVTGDTTVNLRVNDRWLTTIEGDGTFTHDGRIDSQYVIRIRVNGTKIDTPCTPPDNPPSGPVTCTAFDNQIVWTAPAGIDVNVRSVTDGWQATYQGPGSHPISTNPSDALFIRTRIGSNLVDTQCTPPDEPPPGPVTCTAFDNQIVWTAPPGTDVNVRSVTDGWQGTYQGPGNHPINPSDALFIRTRTNNRVVDTACSN